MSDQPGTDLRTLQDFLDGRLSPEQRAEFETRLEHDADLRLELEHAQQVRAALADETPGLSPGFYTRARARFEESGRRKERWSFRLVSWETAGVAAAAVLAMALFVPQLTREGIPTNLGAVATEKQQEVQRDAVTRPDSSFAPEPADARLLGEKEGLEETPAQNEPALEKNQPALPTAPKGKRENVGREPQDAPEPMAQEPMRFADSEADRQEKKTYLGKVVQTEKSDSDKADLRSGREKDLGLSATAEASGETRRARIEREDDAFHAAAPIEEGERAPATDALWESTEQAQGAFDRIQPVVVELPTGLVKRKGLREVEQTVEWADLLAGPYGESIEMLGAPAADRRLVLIGARKGLACDTLAVISDDQEHRIEWTRVPKEREAQGGCALVLPVDGRKITITRPS